MTVSNNKGAVESVAEVFEANDLGAPFKVVLHDAVKIKTCSDTGKVLSYTIPALPQLQAIVVLKRIENPRKLSGLEMKFVRKAVGLKQFEMAEKMDLSVEHLSRCENGLPLSPQNEKLFRGVALSCLARVSELSDKAKQAEIQDALFSLFDNMKIVSAVDASKEIEMNFWYTKIEEEGSSEDASDWLLAA